MAANALQTKSKANFLWAMLSSVHRTPVTERSWNNTGSKTKSIQAEAQRLSDAHTYEGMPKISTIATWYTDLRESCINFALSYGESARKAFPAEGTAKAGNADDDSDASDDDESQLKYTTFSIVNDQARDLPTVVGEADDDEDDTSHLSGMMTFAGDQPFSLDVFHFTGKEQAAMNLGGYDGRNSEQLAQMMHRRIVEIGMDELKAGKTTRADNKTEKQSKKRKQESKDDIKTENDGLTWGSGSGSGSSSSSSSKPHARVHKTEEEKEEAKAKKKEAQIARENAALKAGDPLDTAIPHILSMISPAAQQQQQEFQLKMQSQQAQQNQQAMFAMMQCGFGGRGGGGFGGGCAVVVFRLG